MAIYDNLNTSIHKWEKVNNATLPDGTDRYVCEYCGLEAKRHTLRPSLSVSTRYARKYAKCDGKTFDRNRELLEKFLEGAPFMLYQSLPVDGAEGLGEGDIVFSCKPPVEHAHIDGLWVMGREKPFMVYEREVWPLKWNEQLGEYDLI